MRVASPERWLYVLLVYMRSLFASATIASAHANTHARLLSIPSDMQSPYE